MTNDSSHGPDTAIAALPAGLEAVLRRPGMYVGDTRDGSGIVNMIWEVVGNALDEHLAGRCSTIDIEIAADGTIAVEDDGRGMPLRDVDGTPFAERALTTMHVGPTMDGHAPHEHLIPHGVGVFVVCALSSRLELQVCRDGRRWIQQFARGKALSAALDEGPSDRTGTRIAFLPAADVFEHRHFSADPIVTRLQELAMLFPSLTLRFSDRRQFEFHEPHGLLGHVDRRCASAGRLDVEPFVVEVTVGQIAVDVAARWRRHGIGASIDSYANVLRTSEGGVHREGLIDGLVDGLRDAAPAACAGFGRDVLEEIVTTGLVATVRVRLSDPTYGAPTRDRLVTPEAKDAVRSSVGPAYAAFLRCNAAALAHMQGRLAIHVESEEYRADPDGYIRRALGEANESHAHGDDAEDA